MLLLADGSRVQFIGLKGRADLNGSYGYIECYLPERERCEQYSESGASETSCFNFRYNVKREASDEVIAVKPANCAEARVSESRPNQACYTVPEAKKVQALSILKKDDKAIYTMTGEVISVAKVHAEDDPSDPYYTVLMADGREKQTTREKLSLEASLNVGGTPFTEQVATLCMEGDVLSRFQSGTAVLTIDRDAGHFTTVLAYLNFLADAAGPGDKKPTRPELPSSRGGLKKLKKEAEFFGLTGLQGMCGDKMCNLVL